MANLYLIQLVGILLATAGAIALMTSAHLFGARLTAAEKQRASDEWNRKTNVYRLPISPEAVVSTLFFLGGTGILIWSGFNLCGFLAYWLPPFPEAVKLLLSCR